MLRGVLSLAGGLLVVAIQIEGKAGVERKDKIYEIACMPGYLSPTIFVRSFLKQFGMACTDYLTMKQVKNSPNNLNE